jgi:hypothetical protein
MVRDDAKQVAEHGGVGRDADGNMTGQEAAQGSPQPLFVEGIRALDDLEERVGELRGVSTSTASSRR